MKSGIKSKDDLILHTIAAFKTVFGELSTITLYGLFKMKKYGVTPLKIAIDNLIYVHVLDNDKRYTDAHFLTEIGRQIPYYCDYNIEKIELWD